MYFLYLKIKRLNCKIECYISANYKIPIIIDCAIIPIDFNFQIYDFSNKCFSMNKIDLLLPIPDGNQRNINFFRYLPNDKDLLEIDLHFLINIPFKKRKINAIIKTDSIYKNKSIHFEFDKKEIEINQEKTEFSVKIKINCGDFIYSEIGTFSCEIGGKTHKISVMSKFYQTELSNIKINEIDLFRIDYDIFTSSHRLIPIKDNTNLKKENIYICPYGYWNYNIIQYLKVNENSYNFYYKLEPIPSNNEIYYISDKGEINLHKEDI